MITQYYYSVFNFLEKAVYTEIFNALSEHREQIAFDASTGITAQMLYKVFKGVLYDYPRLFYARPYDCAILHSSSTYILKPEYCFPLSSALELQHWLDEEIRSICGPVASLSDPFAKEIYVHNYLIDNIHYTKEDVAQPANAYTVAGALFEKNCVCAGVALTFKLLMDSLNVPCFVAYGDMVTESGDPSSHAWNYVKIEDQYYQTDVTWDLLEDHHSRVIKYDYFNVTTAEMSASRGFAYQYPVCTATEHNYFHYMNAIVNSPDELTRYVRDKAAAGEKRIYAKYTFSDEDIQETVSRCLKASKIKPGYQYWLREKVQTVFVMCRS